MKNEVVLTIGNGDCLQYVLSLLDVIARHDELPEELGPVTTLAYQILEAYQARSDEAGAATV